LLEQKENIESSYRCEKGTENESDGYEIRWSGGRVYRPHNAIPGTAAERPCQEAYQPEQYAIGLSSEEAARRIDALKAESIPSR
jgi:hypothetical protein